MANNYTRLSDTIIAQEGNAYIMVEGSNRELFEISKLRAQLDMVIQERRMLGNRMTQHKVTGTTGTGSATLYFMNSEQLNQAIQYIKNGTQKNIQLKVMNNDPQSTVGKQEVLLSNVIFKTIPVMALEESDDPVTFDSDFTFDAIESLSSFELPENYRK